MANTLAKSSLIPEAFRGKPAEVFFAISYGVELGMSPVTALMSISVIKGKPSLAANAMVAMVLSSGKAKYFRCVETGPDSATYETLRIGDPEPSRKTFTQSQAKAAGLAGGMYGKYPQQMLEARAKSYLARDVYPDVLHGMASTEEVMEYDGPAHVIEPSSSHDGFAPPDDPVVVTDAAGTEGNQWNYIADIMTCKTEDELSELASALGDLDDEDRKKAREAYKARLAILKMEQK